MSVPKQCWLDFAELIDSYRIFPRLFLVACFAWTVDLSYVLVRWYTHLPHNERGPEASGFGAVAFLGVLGFMKLVYQTYSENGRDWNQVGSTTTTAVATTSTTGPTP